MYIVYAMHREPEYSGGNSWVGKSYIVETYEKAEILSDVLNKLEKDKEISYEILNTSDSIQVNKIAFDENSKLILNPKGEINGES
tara:strand:- start:325 stop:579 length:255 start_codon:yes stop_codon:yes gene_type:complete